jgi:hypothetical protein
MNLNEATAEPSESAAAKSQPTLYDLECIIKRGKATLLEVGDALHEIKSPNLYKNTHPTRETYVKERWGFSQRDAHRLMQAWTESETSPPGDIPKAEREARRRREGKAKRSLSNGNSTSPRSEAGSLPTLAAFKCQMSRWEKFLSGEDFIRFLESISKLVDKRRLALSDRFDRRRRRE